MKTLTRIRLINWHLFENTTITCQGTTYFIGVNGAGKSTILDALPRGARAELFNRVEDYRFHLLNRLGQLRDSFPAKIVKGLAFTPLTDMRRFVLDYLLDESLVDVKNLQAQLETLRHFEQLAAD